MGVGSTAEGGITIDELDRPLPLTGERTAPGVWHERYWFARHLAAYQHLAPSCAGRDVLEAGCGEGYGADVVRRAGARRVLGLDYDARTVQRARHRYCPTGFVRANLVQLPLPDEAFDVVLSLQVIEHIWSPGTLLAEAARVLRPGGTLAVSTPNRLTFSPGLARDARPTNPFHVREFDAEELLALVDEHLDVVGLLGVQPGPRLTSLGHSAIVSDQLATPADGWAADLARAVRATRATDFIVRPAGRGQDHIDTALDLLVLARAR